MNGAETPTRAGKRVVCQIDVIAREIEYVSLIRALFRLQGRAEFDPVFGAPTWKAGRSTFFDVIREPAELLVVNTHHARRTAYNLPWKRGAGARMVIWHTEQLMNELSFPDRMNLGFQAEFNRDVERHIVWGPRFARTLIEHARVPFERIYMVGCPKLDLLQPPFFEKRAPASRRKTAVFVGGFLWAHYDDAQYAAALQRYRFDPTSGYRDFFRPAFERFMQCVRTIAPANPEIDIVVRPHPREPASAYAELAGFPNVKIMADMPFRQVLVEADAVFQWHSTSFFETAVTGTPVYNLNLNPDFKRHWRDYFEIYRWVDPGQVEANFAEMVQSPEPLPLQVREGMEDMFSLSQGPAVARTFHTLSRMLDEAGCAEWSRQDRGRADAALRVHRVKDFIGLASATAVRLGLSNRYTRRVFEAQEKYENGPDFLDPAEVERRARALLADHGEQLRAWADTPVRFNRTDCGWMVSL